VSGNDATGTGNVEVLAAAEALPPQERQKKDDFDMFADDDDMFSEQALSLTADADREQRPATMTIPQIKELDMSLVDDWDDHEGYYRVLLGEMLEGRYHVQANLGKGMFSGVVRALDSKDKKLVAIKIIRSNETMYESFQSALL
jgi:serine/threonine-protein kinase PRP4